MTSISEVTSIREIVENKTSVTDTGDFTAIINKSEPTRGLLLSESGDFSDMKAVLSGASVNDMGDCTYTWLPSAAELDSIDGSHNRSNGKEFFAYTFYAKNVGDVDVSYTANLQIESVNLGADEAVRVMVIKDGGTPTIYAKPKKGTTDVFDTNDKYNKDDKLFVNDSTVMQDKNVLTKAGSYHKYTIVMWLEGWDPDCVNDILGGSIKLSMKFDYDYV